jgi:hypothetical protein
MKKIFAALLILTLCGTASAQNRSGVYELHPNQRVEIVDNSRSIRFSFQAHEGDEVLRLGGTARLVRRNVYEYRTILRGRVETMACRIRFTFTRANVTVEESDRECANLRYPIVSLDGEYEKLNE